MTKKAQWTLCVLLVSMSAAVNARGETPSEDRWSLKLVAAGATSGAFSGDVGFGYGAGLEYRVNDRFGVELGVMDLEVDTGLDFDFGPFSTSVESSAAVTPVTLGLNIYLARSERVGFYVTPMVGYASVGDLETSVRGAFDGVDQLAEVSRLPLDDVFTFGGRLGLDISFSDRTFLTGAITSLQMPLEVSGDLEDDGGDLDPLIFQLGLGFRF